MTMMKDSSAMRRSVVPRRRSRTKNTKKRQRRKRMNALLSAAEAAGLLNDTRLVSIKVRTRSALVRAAKRRAGVRSDQKLLILALAAIALTS